MAITIERQGQRVYLTGDTFAVKDRIKALGGHWDGDRRAWWVGAKKEAEARALADNMSAQPADVPRPKQDPNDIRLTAKGEYKGRTYYLGSQTRDGQRVRCLTLPDANGEYLDFWADLSAVRVVKTYRPREHTFRGHTRTEYTTLGSIAAFIAEQREARSAGEPACAECGKHGGDLVRDLEDGMLKHYRCCDIPPG